jgi:hypothetical protein
VGVQSILSSRHNVEDICNVYADADMFGMGPGIYPKNYAPEYPYHPNCLCILSPVYKGEQANKEDFDGERVEKYLANVPEKTRADILGREGSKAFDKNPSSWENHLTGFNLENKKIVAL